MLLRRLFIPVLIVSWLGACGDDTTTTPDKGMVADAGGDTTMATDTGLVDTSMGSDATGSDATAGVSFAKEIQPILTSTCAKSGCHTGASPKAGMDLSAGKAFASLMSKATLCGTLKRAEPNKPDESFVVQKLEGKGSCFAGQKMPLTGTLPAGGLDSIKKWITEGAKDN